MDSIVSNEGVVKIADEDTNTSRDMEAKMTDGDTNMSRDLEVKMTGDDDANESRDMEMKMTDVEEMDICEEDIKDPGTPPLEPLTLDAAPVESDAQRRRAVILYDYPLEDGHLIEGEHVRNVEIGKNGLCWAHCRGDRIVAHVRDLEIIGTFRFLDLPGEIRNKVYEYLITSEENISLRATSPGITHVSRQVRNESLSLYYASNNFYYTDYSVPPSGLWPKLKDLVQHIGKRNINRIQSLEIPVGDCKNHGESSFFCKMKAFPYAEVTLEWQHHCGSSQEVRRYVIKRLREKIQRRRLSGDMRHTVHCGSMDIGRLFNIFDREGVEYGDIWSYHLF